MTIRVTCENCKSVLKIRDELAGTSAKCPKCKTAFSIPAAGADESSGSSADQPEESPEDILARLVDIPHEVTPPADYFSDEEFDPDEALADHGSSPGTPTGGAAVAAAPKPSVAELMRQHEADMAKKKGRKKKPEKSEATAAAAASVMTVGTASEALTRTYDQKRGKAAEGPRLSREEQRALEEKEAIKGFAIRGMAGLLTILVVGYFFQAWFFATPLPDLGYVSGIVTQNGQPLVGVEVRFEPVSPPGGLALEMATSSSGFTNSEGTYTLMFDPENEGVIPGTSKVTIIMPSGVSFVLPEADQSKDVNVNESHTFNFNL